MNKDTFKRLWRPFLLFLTFAGFTVVKRDLLLQFGTEAVDQSQKVIAYVVQIGIWLSAAHFLNRLALVFFWDGLVARTIGAPIPRLIKDIFTIVVYLIAITGIVGIVFQKSVTGFWATSGVVGVILGFALRNMILDVFTGLAINIDRPYKIGDWIKVHAANPEQNIVGKIMEFNWRTTRLQTQDDSVAVLPNSLLGTMMVTNFWGSGPESRFEITVCLDFSVPTERACRVLSAGAHAAVGQSGILEQPEPRVIVSGTTAVGIEYKIRYWMAPWTDDITEGAGRSHVTTNVLAHLKQAGITPAYPKQDLFHAKMPTRHLDSTTIEDRTKLLGQTELFKHLDSHELGELAASMKQRYYKRGEKLIQQGEAGDSMFILSEGLLHAFLNSENGQDAVRVGQIVPGEFFGEMSLLTGEARSATIMAITDVVAHEITKENINSLLTKRPQIATTISKVVAERRVMNSQKMAAATPEERIEETESLAKQIMTKMKAFFKGVFEKKQVA